MNGQTRLLRSQLPVGREPKNRFPEGHNNNILFQLLQPLYANTTTALDGNPDEIFKTYLGVRQGLPESPFLYSLYMDYVMRVFLLQCEAEQVHFMKLNYAIPPSATKNGENNLLGSYGTFLLDG